MNRGYADSNNIDKILKETEAWNYNFIKGITVISGHPFWHSAPNKSAKLDVIEKKLINKGLFNDLSNFFLISALP